MMNRIVRSGQVANGVAGQLAGIGKIFAHRNHFPVELVALGSAIIVLACVVRWSEFGDAHPAAAEEVLLKRAICFVAIPVESEGGLHFRSPVSGGPSEERGDVLLPV